MVDLLFFVLLAFPTGCFSISSLRPKEAASASSPSTSSSLSIPDESVKIKFRKAFVRPLAGLPGSIPMSMWAEVDTSSHSKLDAKLVLRLAYLSFCSHCSYRSLTLSCVSGSPPSFLSSRVWRLRPSGRWFSPRLRSHWTQGASSGVNVLNTVPILVTLHVGSLLSKASVRIIAIIVLVVFQYLLYSVRLRPFLAHKHVTQKRPGRRPTFCLVLQTQGQEIVSLLGERARKGGWLLAHSNVKQDSHVGLELAKRWLPRGHLYYRAAHTPYVGLAAMPRLLHHFWGHPVRGTFQRPIAFSIGEHVESLGSPKVGEFADSCVVDKDVCALDVAVHDSVRVQVVKPR